MENNRAGRPKSCRRVKEMPKVRCFKPQGIPGIKLEEMVLSVDEMESLRLADLEGLYQSEAARRMDVSRQTFGRIIDSAHRKVADAIIHGKSIVIEGGVVMKREEQVHNVKPGCVCQHCGHEESHRSGLPCRDMICPECGHHMIRKGGCGTGQEDI
ncbi:MAG: DUF134 domain-containing protein [Prosthecochloris sp.]|uniref:DUF134 domain-containing protein n=1 Tax=unclassified Prosthecochloris TaxID=2632826 RepID=UPI000DF73F79|nr:MULTISPECIES: DUF134 domain-containing protein [unclassified Prosthecochloris]MCW8797953.1 DUF134 domain-containing protein [Prosthecochloris sp.]RDD30192.1 hypothetical protein CR161_05415 [Prosthecochloris sp. ZM]